MVKGKLVGYARISSVGQNPERQLQDCKVDKLFLDRCSGKDRSRPQLEALLDYVRDGDVVVVHSMDRLARNLGDLREIVSLLVEKQVEIRFLKEGLVFSGEETPMAQLLLSIMGAFGEFERALIKERQQEGIELAKKRGVYKGRKRKLSAEELERMLELVREGRKKTQIAQELGIRRETVYLYLSRERVSLTSESSKGLVSYSPAQQEPSKEKKKAQEEKEEAKLDKMLGKALQTNDPNQLGFF